MLVDHLSRLVNDEITKQECDVLEEFPDEKLLMVQEITWFNDIANHKATDMIADDLKW